MALQEFGNSYPKTPSLHTLFRRVFCPLLLITLATIHADAQATEFVTRSGRTLQLGGRPFYFLGANAYYLMESAARGDTATVQEVFETSRSLGINVIRTWGFFDSSDSLNPAVIQFRPGRYNEHALKALDYVIAQAKRIGIKLLIPLVNNWDDYGGMNQYIRWRMVAGQPKLSSAPRYSNSEVERSVTGQRGQSYRVALSTSWGHDDFYRDPIIIDWYKTYIATLVNRVNTFTGQPYRNETAIFGWELANEPRSSDRSTQVIRQWIEDVSLFVKSIDPNHLVGTGEEGFDNTAAPYSQAAYQNQQWLFDGSMGVSFSQNSAIASVDFASIHLYPEAWNLPNSTGNTWIIDHVRIAGSVPSSSGGNEETGKPLLVGEFGVRDFKRSTYDSWLTTAVLEDAAGALVWQLLGGRRGDAEGFGIRCSVDYAVCSLLRHSAEQFGLKVLSGGLAAPSEFSLQQNYPNPFNGQTTISYTLPLVSRVRLEIYDLRGAHIANLVDGIQHAGLRKELLDARKLASGTYFYRLVVAPLTQAGGFSQTRKLLLIK